MVLFDKEKLQLAGWWYIMIDEELKKKIEETAVALSTRGFEITVTSCEDRFGYESQFIVFHCCPNRTVLDETVKKQGWTNYRLVYWSEFRTAKEKCRKNEQISLHLYE